MISTKTTLSPCKIVKKLVTPEACHKFCSEASKPVVFVPTMGALHKGHEALLSKGRKLAGKNGTLVGSIFVNPTQFGPGEDFSRYPRTWTLDRAMCERQGVDAVFLPTPKSMYAQNNSVRVEESRLSSVLCGASRPGHFQGVCTVVAKLLNVVQPTNLLLGEKDWQQLAILRRMVRDLNFPVKVVPCPTVREADGLALSSRNRFLSVEERAIAPKLYAALCKIREQVAAGETSVEVLHKSLRIELEGLPATELDYAEIMDAETLEPVKELQGRVRAAVAVRFRTARLIDNLQIFPPQ